MFSRKKIAATVALLGGLTTACVIAPQAHAADPRGLCTRDVQGNVTCLQRTAGANEDGRYSVNQVQSCEPTSPLSIPAHGLLNPGSMQVGPSITCNNSARVPGESSSQSGGGSPQAGGSSPQAGGSSPQADSGSQQADGGSQQAGDGAEG